MRPAPMANELIPMRESQNLVNVDGTLNAPSNVYCGSRAPSHITLDLQRTRVQDIYSCCLRPFDAVSRA
jgi:hypothetical protein